MVKRALPPTPPTPPTSNDGGSAPHTITMEDMVTGTVSQKKANEVPKGIAFVDGVPVTRIVTQAKGDGDREILAYDEKGELLQVTLMTKRS